MILLLLQIRPSVRDGGRGSVFSSRYDKVILLRRIGPSVANRGRRTHHRLVSGLLLNDDLSSLRIQADSIAFFESGGNARYVRHCRQPVLAGNDGPV